MSTGVASLTPKFRIVKFGLNNGTVKSIGLFKYLEPFRRYLRVWQTDGRTDILLEYAIYTDEQTEKLPELGLSPSAVPTPLSTQA